MYDSPSAFWGGGGMLENREGWSRIVLFAFNLWQGKDEMGLDGLDGIVGKREAAWETFLRNEMVPECHSAAPVALKSTCEM